MNTLTKILYLVSSLFPIFAYVIRENEPRVTTELGEIIGNAAHFNDCSQIYVKEFLGVPFANPPIGELRFQRPALLEPWSEARVCKTMPKACVQYTTAPFPWAMNPDDMDSNVDEDCLYMNIWVPMDASPQNRKAVFFWIHGGGFFTGSIRQEIYDGRVLAGLGDVIVVTTNYRLGSLGFWSSDQETAPGNVGMLDMIASLTWVHTHIRAFGGDETQITVAGEGAGAVAAGMLVMGNTYSRMIRRLIMQSGSPLYQPEHDDHLIEQHSFLVAKGCRCANESYTLEYHPQQVEACMRSVNALKILKEEGKIIPKSSRSFLPRYSATPLERNPRHHINEGDFNHVELFIGTNSFEGTFHVTTSYPELLGFFGEKDTEISREQAEEILRQLFGSYPCYDEIVEHYLPFEETNFKLAVSNAYGDFFTVYPAVDFAEKFAEQGMKVYFYTYNHRPSRTVWAKWMETTYFEEVQFVFGRPFLYPNNYTRLEKKLSRLMIENWTNFTKTGNPTNQSSTNIWPLYSRESPVLMWYNITERGVEQSIEIGPHKDKIELLRRLWKYLTPDEELTTKIPIEVDDMSKVAGILL